MNGKLQGYPIQFNIYATDEQEVEELRRSIVGFIGLHASHGRAVTAKKVTKALNEWDKNPIIKNRIINYFE